MSAFASLTMHMDQEVALYFAVYHSCSKRRVAIRAFGDGFQPTPWTCNCCSKLTQCDDLGYDLLVRKVPRG